MESGTFTTSAPTPQVGPSPDEQLAAVRNRLLRQAYLFDDPAAYQAGVEDALEILSGHLLRDLAA